MQRFTGSSFPDYVVGPAKADDGSLSRCDSSGHRQFIDKCWRCSVWAADAFLSSVTLVFVVSRVGRRDAWFHLFRDS